MYPTARIVKVDGRDLAVEDPGPESGFPTGLTGGNMASERGRVRSPNGRTSVYGIEPIGTKVLPSVREAS